MFCNFSFYVLYLYKTVVAWLFYIWIDNFCFTHIPRDFQSKIGFIWFTRKHPFVDLILLFRYPLVYVTHLLSLSLGLRLSLVPCSSVPVSLYLRKRLSLFFKRWNFKPKIIHWHDMWWAVLLCHCCCLHAAQHKGCVFCSNKRRIMLLRLVKRAMLYQLIEVPVRHH